MPITPSSAVTASSAAIVRPSVDADLAAVTRIYAHHVLNGTGTFETSPPSEDEMRTRRADVLGKNLPWLVLEVNGQVMGFAYGNWFKPRPAYRFSVEDSIYLASEATGKGLGKLMMAELLQVASVFLLVGAIGLVRLPDFYMRLHAPTKASTLGVGGVLLASMLVGLAQGQPGITELLITLFVFVTAPVSANVLAQAALHLRLPSKAKVPPGVLS
jgi:monovalent cation/proton antiporter MnhG/PhaG subunit